MGAPAGGAASQQLTNWEEKLHLVSLTNLDDLLGKKIKMVL